MRPVRAGARKLAHFHWRQRVCLPLPQATPAGGNHGRERQALQCTTVRAPPLPARRWRRAQQSRARSCTAIRSARASRRLRVVTCGAPGSWSSSRSAQLARCAAGTRARAGGARRLRWDLLAGRRPCGNSPQCALGRRKSGPLPAGEAASDAWGRPLATVPCILCAAQSALGSPVHAPRAHTHTICRCAATRRAPRTPLQTPAMRSAHSRLSSSWRSASRSYCTSWRGTNRRWQQPRPRQTQLRSQGEAAAVAVAAAAAELGVWRATAHELTGPSPSTRRLCAAS